MNWFDFIVLGVLVVLVVLIIVGRLFGRRFTNDWFDGTELCACSIVILIIVLVFTVPLYLVIDRASGSTIGTITSVDKNFWGTTAVYIKTSETTQEEYCIEDDTIADLASELIGKEVKISYGSRVGIYSISKCHQSPIEEIEVIEEEIK